MRNEISEAIEKATDPAEQARLRLELAAIEQEDAARRSSLRISIATLLAGGVAAWGAVAAWRQLQDNRQQAEAVRRETDEQLRLARDGQLTERFTRAVDQLGHTNLDVRLGGIYALERIARDLGDDRENADNIAELLGAFVRRRLLRGSNDDEGSPRDPDARDDRGQLAAWALDAQAALTVLGRLPATRNELLVDLRNTDMRGADLFGADLSWISLGGADLRGVELQAADLDGAGLRSADLRDANLTDARAAADLTEADLRGAVLRGADLNGYGIGAQLTRADLRGADLRDTDLSRANLDAVGDLTGARADSRTRWPRGFVPEEAGVIFVDREKPPGNGVRADA